MKPLLRSLIVVSSFLPVVTAGVLAGEMGISAGGQWGRADWTWDAEDTNFEGTSTGMGLAFVYDTAAFGESIFNYRLGVGLEYFQAEASFDSKRLRIDDQLQLGSLVLDNDFGFALLRRTGTRLWIGPSVRIGYHAGDFEQRGQDIRLLELGAGPTFGANFRVGDRFSICPSIGARYSTFRGTVGAYDHSDSLRGSGIATNLTVAFLWGKSSRSD